MLDQKITKTILDAKVSISQDDRYTVLYCRVSSDEQAEENNVSLPDQERKLREYAERHNLNNLVVLKEDHPGFQFDRPELNKLCAMIEADQVKAVLFKSIDRLTREQAVLDQLRKNYFIPYNIEVHSIEDLGRLKWDIYSGVIQDQMAVYANFWGKILVKVMQDGIRAKIRKGSVICFNNPPYGYRVTRNGKTDLFELVIEETEAHWVRQIFHWYVYDGLGGAKIRDRLDELGVPTPGSSGQWWSAKTILGILENETYAGKWRYGKKSKNPEMKALPPVPVPPIVDRGLFDLAQEQRKHNGQHLRKTAKYEYMLSGMVKCVHCGLALIGHPKTYKDRDYFYLWYRHGYSKHGCKKSFRADGKNGVDLAVWQYIESFMRDLDLLQRSVEKYLADEESRRKPMLDRLQSIENSIREKERELTRLTDAYQAGVLELDVFAARKQAVDSSLASYQRQKKELAEGMKNEHSLDELTETIALMHEIQDELDHLDFETKRKIIKGLNTEVTVEKLGYNQHKVHVECVLGNFSWCLSDGVVNGPVNPTSL